MAIHAASIVLANPVSSSSSSSSVSISAIVIVTGGRDGAVRVWHSSTGTMLREFLGHTKQVLAVRMLPMAQGALQVKASGGDQAAAATAADSPGGDSGGQVPCSIISSADDIRVWDGMSGACVHVLQPHKHLVSCLLPVEGQAHAVVSCSWDKTCIVWDTRSWQQQRSVALHTASITAAACGPGGKVATGTLGGEVVIWDATTGGVLVRAQRT